jgi:hypothetical protein
LDRHLKTDATLSVNALETRLIVMNVKINPITVSKIAVKNMAVPLDAFI